MGLITVGGWGESWRKEIDKIWTVQSPWLRDNDTSVQNLISSLCSQSYIMYGIGGSSDLEPSARATVTNSHNANLEALGPIESLCLLLV